jgi:hypothetical protein
MTTQELREKIKAGAETVSARARLWPNGLGFDWRGWEYTIAEPSGDWHATHPGSNRHFAYGPRRRQMSGSGDTPESARRMAK